MSQGMSHEGDHRAEPTEPDGQQQRLDQELERLERVIEHLQARIHGVLRVEFPSADVEQLAAKAEANPASALTIQVNRLVGHTDRLARIIDRVEL